MNTEPEIWQFAAERLERGEAVVLLVVAASAGSSPGRQGFKMVVAKDELAGSIGGGVMEVALVEQAKLRITDYKSQNRPVSPETQNESKIQNPKSKIVEQVHRKNSENASGMICSGRQTVIFFELNSGHLHTVRTIVESLEKRQPCRLRISNLEFQISDSSPESEDFRFVHTGENEFVYEEKPGLKENLFIVGGGHCALALSEIAAKLGFHISLFDDRADLNTLAKNEFAHEKRVIESYEKIGEFIPAGENSYVVVMTLGYRFDEIVIRKLFDKEFKYFGVLGSRAKMKTLLSALEKEGFDTEKLSRIRTPVGLKINSRTPFEIAVSIAAEIIAVKNAAE